MEVSATIKKMFLDKKAIVDAVEKSQTKILSKAGGLVRKSAQDLLVFKPAIRKPRKTKNVRTNMERMAQYRAMKKAAASPPGAVPFIRRKQYPNLSSIRYDVIPSAKKVIIGPIVRRNRSMERTAPNVHEFGGSVRINVHSKDGKVHPTVAHYQKRPLMGPALEKIASKLPNVLKSAIGPS